MFRVFHNQSYSRAIRTYCFLQTSEPKISVLAINSMPCKPGNVGGGRRWLVVFLTWYYKYIKAKFLMMNPTGEGYQLKIRIIDCCGKGYSTAKELRDSPPSQDGDLVDWGRSE